jgi:hypothetical protein
MCVQADSNRCAKCKVLWAVECPLLAYNNVLGGFEELYCIVNQGQQRNRGFSRERIRGVWKPLCPYKASLSFPGHCSAVAVFRLI